MSEERSKKEQAEQAWIELVKGMSDKTKEQVTALQILDIYRSSLRDRITAHKKMLQESYDKINIGDDICEVRVLLQAITELDLVLTLLDECLPLNSK